MRVEGEAPPAARRKPLGFSLEESVDRVTAMLTNIGLVGDFAPIVVVLGHGSTSLNNPHESAHDCGACGGRRGGANARLFADMANRPDVREGVRRKGIDIPADTWFVGALHDTASDEVRYYDLELLPASHAARFSEAVRGPRARPARQRSRTLPAVRRRPLDLTPEAALRHVEARSSNLAQPRPEYGHCTNAICIVGRRSLTQRPASRPAGVPRQLRPHHRSHDRDRRAHPGRGRPGRRRHQPRVLLLVGRQRAVRLRDEAAAQRHRADRRDERPPERSADRAAAADGGDPRADAAAADRRCHARRRCWPWPDGSPKSPSSSSIDGSQLVAADPETGDDARIRGRAIRAL